MLNRTILQGRLVADPELRHTQAGIATTTFRLAVDRDFKEKSSGERTADFFPVVAWRHTAEFVSRYFTKGRMVVVEGKLRTRTYDDSNGVRRTVTEVFADSVYFSDSKAAASSEPAQGTPASSDDFQEVTGDLEGELPF